jgi:hypothetical protein
MLETMCALRHPLSAAAQVRIHDWSDFDDIDK